MWKADFLSWKSKEDYVRAYKGDELVWDWSGLTIEVTFHKGTTEQDILSVSHYGTNANTTKPNIEYSKNGSRWTELTGTVYGKTGDIIRLRGNNTTISSSSANYSRINIGKDYNNARVKMFGNIMSLLSKYDYESLLSVPNYCFYKLFGNGFGQSLTDISELILPATTVGQYAYANMFNYCDNLASGIKRLPATNLGNYCYQSMFQDCRKLTEAPVLPATKLADGCYYNMFRYCTHLTNAPVLPATTLTSSCYSGMFSNCTSLVTAPALPSTTIASNCYYNMFANCTSLVNAPVLPAKTMKTYSYYQMFYNCSSLVNAPALPATTLNTYCYYSMFQGCGSLDCEIVLPANVLKQRCYNAMFQKCSNLKYINCQATETADMATFNWVSKVASAGTFVKNSAATFWTTGVNGIPEGWTVTTE